MCEIHTTLCKCYGHVSGCLITKGKGTPKSKKDERYTHASIIRIYDYVCSIQRCKMKRRSIVRNTYYGVNNHDAKKAALAKASAISRGK